MWPESAKTQTLLIAAGEGDADAVGQLLARHRPALRRMIDMRLDPKLRQRLDASDVVQDVLIDAHRRLDEYLADPKMPFHLWIRLIAKDRIIDAHRRHRGAARRSLDREQPMHSPGGIDQSTMDLAAQLCDPELTPAARATWEELQRRFRDALDELPEADREVVLMRHFEHLSNSEVAAALDLSEPAASMRYMRSMRKLRSILGEEPSASG